MLRFLIFPSNHFGGYYLIFLLALLEFLYLFRNKICSGFDYTKNTLKRLGKTASKLVGHLVVCAASFVKLSLQYLALFLLLDQALFLLLDLFVLNQFVLALLTPQFLDTIFKWLNFSVILGYYLLQEVDFATLLVRKPILKALVLLCEFLQLMQDFSKALILLVWLLWLFFVSCEET